MASVGAPLIGLDLGTLHLRAALLRDKQIQLINDELGNNSTPAYIGFDRQEKDQTTSTLLLGRHAYDLAQKDLTLPVYGLKKLLGRRADDPVVVAEKACLPFEVVAGDPDGLAVIKTPGGSKLYTPEELLSLLVQNVIRNVDVYCGVPVKEAVVTVPACFSLMERDKVVRLCASAGIKVKRMMNEAWAAAVAHGFETELTDEVNAIVVSLGAGFIDIACITIDDTIYEVCSSYASPITPDMLDEFNSENFQSIIKIVKIVRSESKMLKVNRIFLSGGSPFLPSLQKAFHDLFTGLNPVIIANPSTAAIRGVAIYAALLGGSSNTVKRLRDLLILSATNFALGIKTADGKTRTVINQNTTYAAKGERQFTTSVDDQTSVVFEVYETGEQGGVCEEHYLGEVVLSDLPPLLKGRLVLDVKIEVDFNHVVTVTAVYAKLNLEKKLTISKVIVVSLNFMHNV